MTDGATIHAPRAVQRSAEQLAEGERVPLDARRPRLVEAGTAMRLARGHADLFAVAIADGAAAGPRRHLCRIEAPELILGLPLAQGPNRAPIGVLAVGGQGAEAVVLDRALIKDDALAGWIAKLGLAIADMTAGGTRGRPSAAASTSSRPGSSSARPPRALCGLQSIAAISRSWAAVRSVGLAIRPCRLRPGHGAKRAAPLPCGS